MKKKTKKMKHKVGVILAGTLLFTGMLFLVMNPKGTFNAIKHTTTTISSYVNGKDDSTADGSYSKQGTGVSDSQVAADSNDATARMVSEPVDEPVYGDQASSKESLELPVVKLYNAAGEPVGSATLEQVNDGVKVRITASGLTPGKHGFHVHENAIQDRDFKTAGAHFNPTGKQHGLKNPQGSHVGDMPNLVVRADGTAEAEMLIQHGTLAKDQPNSVRGRSLIIHAGEDDNVTDPAGNSGDRVAGGNIPE